MLTLACTVYGNGDTTVDTAYIVEWDFATNQSIPIVVLDGDPTDELNDGFDYLPITALAVDPVSGELLAFTQEATRNGIYSLSEDAGATLLSDTADYGISGADFDRSGQLWVTTDRAGVVDRVPEPGESGLATVVAATGELAFNAAWLDQNEIRGRSPCGARRSCRHRSRRRRGSFSGRSGRSPDRGDARVGRRAPSAEGPGLAALGTLGPRARSRRSFQPRMRRSSRRSTPWWMAAECQRDHEDPGAPDEVAEPVAPRGRR